MASLRKHLVVDLMQLADDLNVELNPREKKAVIIEKIIEREADEAVLKDYLDCIVQQRLESEKAEQVARERAEKALEREALEKEKALEREALEKEKALEREALEREKALEREALEKRAERDFELAKLKLVNEAETISTASLATERAPKINVKTVMNQFDPEKSDMVLYLTLFERQAGRIKLAQEDWVTHLLALLPSDIAEIVIREPLELMGDYKHIKKVLLDRFRLSPEAFRLKFSQHIRKPGSMWKDVLWELTGYLDQWLAGIKVTTFDDLKKLMICNQIKRRVPNEIKDHFLDEWSDLIDPKILVDKLDDFETVRKPFKKPITPKFTEKRQTEKPKQEFRSAEVKPENGSRTGASGYEARDKEWRTKQFEKKAKLKCFHCGGENHFKSSCPDLMGETTEQINHICFPGGLNKNFKPYLSTAKINGQETQVLRDSGGSYDVVSKHLISDEDYTGETVLIQQPLDDHLTRLPVAHVLIESLSLGVLKTKAAVVKKFNEYYILGNRTQELIDRRLQKSRLNRRVDKRPQTTRKTRDRSRKIINDTRGNFEGNERAQLASEKAKLSIRLPLPGDNRLEGSEALSERIKTARCGENFRPSFERAKKTTLANNRTMGARNERNPFDGKTAKCRHGFSENPRRRNFEERNAELKADETSKGTFYRTSSTQTEFLKRKGKGRFEWENVRNGARTPAKEKSARYAHNYGKDWLSRTRFEGTNQSKSLRN